MVRELRPEELRQYVRNLQYETYAHATEDLNKVKRALLNLIPSDVAQDLTYTYEVQEGHYGNRIIIVRTLIYRPHQVQEVLKYLAEKLSPEDKKFLRETLNLRIDPAGNLYLRFSKQYAYRGILKLEDGDDVVRLRISFTLRARKYGIEKLVEELGLLA